MENLLLSHPDQYLNNHLLGVSIWAEKLHSSRELDIWDDTTLMDLLKIVTLSHDFAKATSYFQKYIRNPNKKGGPLERHSQLSAVVGYNLAKQYLVDHAECIKLSFLMYIVIKRHHGNLKDIENEYTTFGAEDRDLLIRQINSLDFNLLEEVWAPLYSEMPRSLSDVFPLTRDMLIEWVSVMKDDLKQTRRWWLENMNAGLPIFGDCPTIQEEYKLDEYFKLTYIYSLLLDADKRQVGVREYNNVKIDLPPGIVDSYIKYMTWGKTKLNLLRQMAYAEIADNITLAESGRLFSITLPTGLGKTLAGYNFAFKLRDKRLKERGFAPKIIYALPFLSVIDQNYDILSEVLDKGQLSGHNVLLKHHHLTDPVYMLKGGDEEIEYSPNASKLLIEGWAAEVVVTTFVQLFETIIGWRNSSLRRFHNLAHSIIILDEIQALPVPYWKLVQQVLEYIMEKMYVDIVLVTATQPKIFTGKVELQELVNVKEYFKKMDRVELKVDLIPRTVEEFVSEVVEEEFINNPGKSFLFIFNTIASAKNFYKLLSEMVDEPIAFLSTGVVMGQRSQRIKALRDKEYRLAVSTQLVEAGVDIDFDIVFRDFAPMDSINQAAGRCNRNNIGEKGIVNIICLVNDNRKKTYASMVYNKTSLDITQGILEGRALIKENDLLDVIDEYFLQAKDKRRANESYDLLEAMQSLRFFSDDESRVGINDFQLIKQKGTKANIFIELDQTAQDVWLEYEDIIECRDFYQRQERFNLIKKKFYNYVISITANEKTALPPEVNNFLYVNRHQLKSYYDENLGFDTSNYENIF